MTDTTEVTFTKDLDRRLVAGLVHDREATLVEFAALGITRPRALSRAKTLGLTKGLLRWLKIHEAQIELRSCLGCSDRFLSHGSHNRFCDPCRKKGERRVRD